MCSSNTGCSAFVSHTCFVVVVLSVGSTDGIESLWTCTVSEMKVNARVCAFVPDHDRESGLSEPTVTLGVF